MVRDLKTIEAAFSRMAPAISQAVKLFGRPLTLTEKLLVSHLCEIPGKAPERKKSYVNLAPDRVAMQDATAQMALLQFMQAGRKTAAVPATIHCDHLICAETGATADLDKALKVNQEVYSFLQAVAQKYSIGFWKPGAGIIHQILLENYAFPGGLMIGTDSHTPNAGGLGMLSVGVGGADAVDVMAGMPWELKWPGIIGVRLSGKLKGWATPKDVILYLLGLLTVKGGTGCVMEYFGEGTQTLSCTGKATITNMGAELGATGSLFPYDEKMAAFLKATGRSEVAALADKSESCLNADPDVLRSPEKFFDNIIEIDLSKLEPLVTGPHTPDRVRPVSKMKQEALENGFPEELSAGLVGSCTNASYEDLGKAAHVAEQAIQSGLKAKSAFYITPGSDLVYETAERDGFIAKLEAIGGKVLSNSCGQCIGQWNRLDSKKNEKNAIITTFNRNFAARNDGSPHTLAFISSPVVVTAQAIAGQIVFDPARDAIATDKKSFRFDAPQGEELPPKGFVESAKGYLAPSADTKSTEVRVNPKSDRLQLLSPFQAWDGKNMDNLLVLFKVKGKCTTDHISPAGPWLKYRGHLDNISNNAFLGAVNAFTGETGKGTNVLTGETSKSFPEIARSYKAQGRGWVVVGDENYGEGSSREHAAMSPRFLGAKAIIARSFARIHETNLKKQGLLPLVFANPSDYEKIKQGDSVSILGLQDLSPEKNLTLCIKHIDGSEEKAELKHTLSPMQVEWLRAGSALNLIAAQHGS